MIMELADETPHAYVPFLPAVKSSQPQNDILRRMVCKSLQRYSIFSYHANFLWKKCVLQAQMQTSTQHLPHRFIYGL